MDFFRKKYKKFFFNERKFDVEVVKYEKTFNLRAGKFHFAKYKKNFFKKIEEFFYSRSFLFSELGLKNESGGPVIYYFRTKSIFRTLAYLQPWYIQNPSISRPLVYSQSETYSETCQASTVKRFAKIVNGYNYFHKL